MRFSGRCGCWPPASANLPADMVVRRGVPAGDIILTMREHDVLSGLRSGLSNKEIADNLSLSEVTV